MHAVAHLLRGAGAQHQRCMRLRLDGAGEDHARAVRQQLVRQMLAGRRVKLRIAEEIHAQRHKVRIRAHEHAGQHVQRAGLDPHGGGVQMVDLVDEVLVAEDAGVGQALADVREDAQAAAVLGHGQQYRPSVVQRLADQAHQHIDVIGARVAARLMAVVAVQHGQVGLDAHDGVSHVHASRGVVIAGKEDGAAPFADGEPGAAGAVAAAAPDERDAAGQLRRRIGQAQALEDDRLVNRRGELARGFRRGDDTAVEAHVVQVLKRAGLVFVRVGQKEVPRGADLLRRQMGQLVACIAALIAAVHDERYLIALNKITVALLVAGLACQIELHVYLLHARASAAAPRNLNE